MRGGRPQVSTSRTRPLTPSASDRTVHGQIRDGADGQCLRGLERRRLAAVQLLGRDLQQGLEPALLDNLFAHVVCVHDRRRRMLGVR